MKLLSIKSDTGQPIISPGQMLLHLKERKTITKQTLPKNIIIQLIGNLLVPPVRTKKFLQAQLHIQSQGFGVLTGVGMGSPSMAMYLELLFAAGVERVITLGFAGALSDDLNFGDVVLVEKAIVGEGTTGQYLGETTETFSSQSLDAAILEYTQDQDLDVKKVSCWTTDALFMETNEKLKWCLKHGVQVVDMEASAAFTIAKVRKKDVSALMIISDRLAGSNWEPTPASLNTQIKKAFELAQQALLSHHKDT